MIDVKKVVVEKKSLFPVFFVAAAIALVIAGNVIIAKSAQVSDQYAYIAQ